MPSFHAGGGGGQRTPRHNNNGGGVRFGNFGLSPPPAPPLSSSSPRTPKFDFDSKSPDCLQLCMDVPFTDHPYLIGPRGRKSQYFMTRYKSLIHFPDTNCRPNGVKLNNVLVSGKMKNVEEIRSQMRLRTPVRLLIQLRQFAQCEKLVRRIEDAISERSLPIRFTFAQENCTGVLKTEWRNQELLVEFCEEFLGPAQLKKNAVTTELYTLAVALLPLINPWNRELSHRLVGNLFEQTGCRVFYPCEDKYATEPPTYFVKGASVSGLLQSGKYLMGLTMLQITFHLPPNAVPTVAQHSLNDWQQNLLVHTTIFSPSPTDAVRQFRVTLRSFEFCLNGVYAVRSALLGFKKSVQTTAYDFMKLAKHIIPYTVFADAKLYYPLYSIDDKNLNWSGVEFFERFYGGPYSLLMVQQQQQQQQLNTLPEEEAVHVESPVDAHHYISPATQQLHHQHQVSPRQQKQQQPEDESSELELAPLRVTGAVQPLFESPRPFTFADFHFAPHHVPTMGMQLQQQHPLFDTSGAESCASGSTSQTMPQFVFFHAVANQQQHHNHHNGSVVFSSPGCLSASASSSSPGDNSNNNTGNDTNTNFNHSSESVESA